MFYTVDVMNKKIGGSMLNKLNIRLANVADHMAELESQLKPYLTSEQCTCCVDGKTVYLEYKHDLEFESASHQGEALLGLLKIPMADGERNLLVDVIGNETMTKFHLDLSCSRDDDLLLQYICKELLAAFRQLETTLPSSRT